MTYAEWKKENFNYECITTFWSDFTIADKFGVKAIKDTFNRAFKEWKSDYKYLTELVVVLNDKCWLHYGEKNEKFWKLYSELFYKAKYYAEKNLKGDEFRYYFEITD